MGSSPARCQASTLDKHKEREIVSTRRQHLLHPPPCRASLHGGFLKPYPHIEQDSVGMHMFSPPVEQDSGMGECPGGKPAYCVFAHNVRAHAGSPLPRLLVGHAQARRPLLRHLVARAHTSHTILHDHATMRAAPHRSSPLPPPASSSARLHCRRALPPSRPAAQVAKPTSIRLVREAPARLSLHTRAYVRPSSFYGPRRPCAVVLSICLHHQRLFRPPNVILQHRMNPHDIEHVNEGHPMRYYLPAFPHKVFQPRRPRTPPRQHPEQPAEPHPLGSATDVEYHISVPMSGSQQAMSRNRLPSQGTHSNPAGDLTLTELVLQLREEIRRMDQHMREGLAGIEERVTESDCTVQGIMGCIVALEGVVRESRRDQAVKRPHPQRLLSPIAPRHPQPRVALAASDQRGRHNDYDRDNFEEIDKTSLLLVGFLLTPLVGHETDQVKHLRQVYADSQEVAVDSYCSPRTNS
ncbi:hypothetical protein Taro_006706 [Colocasia esculenta]|uniref:Uncharacterized protein n=1 Tax=Colocasia esculenta TaxID=4460 RepID=A0A843TWU0_COLES|nr:hypothetical protein [Colocasia esculenta]